MLEKKKLYWIICKSQITQFSNDIYFKDRPKISVLMLNEFKRVNLLLFPYDHPKTVGFLMILGGIEVNSNKFA